MLPFLSTAPSPRPPFPQHWLDTIFFSHNTYRKRNTYPKKRFVVCIATRKMQGLIWRCTTGFLIATRSYAVCFSTRALSIPPRVCMCLAAQVLDWRSYPCTCQCREATVCVEHSRKNEVRKSYLRQKPNDEITNAQINKTNPFEELSPACKRKDAQGAEDRLTTEGSRNSPPSCDYPNTSRRRFALGARRDACLVGENPACSVPALLRASVFMVP